MPFSVSVLCVLCAFVVKFPFSVSVPHRFLVAFLYRSRALPAHYTPAGCSNVIHPSRQLGHRNRPCSPLPASSISVGPLQTYVHTIFNVNKCTYLYRQLPSSYAHPPKNALNVAKCGSVRPSRRVRLPSFTLHLSSFLRSVLTYVPLQARREILHVSPGGNSDEIAIRYITSLDRRVGPAGVDRSGGHRSGPGIAGRNPPPDPHAGSD